MVYGYCLRDFPERSCDPILLYREIRGGVLGSHLDSVNLVGGRGGVVEISLVGVGEAIPVATILEGHVRDHRPRLRRFTLLYPRQGWALARLPDKEIKTGITDAIKRGVGQAYIDYLWEMAGILEARCR